MNLKELREYLENFEDDYEVYFDHEPLEFNNIISTRIGRDKRMVFTKTDVSKILIQEIDRGYSVKPDPND